jgi:hypothetical protein
MKLLLKIEFSLYSPIADRKGKKCCPFCGRFERHDIECDLNIHLIELLSNKFTMDSMRLIHVMLKQIEWCGFNQICPYCKSQRGVGHELDCIMKGVELL